MKSKLVIFWFRRDLRLEDNTGLQQALASGYPVLPMFIFDTEILDRLVNKYDRRVDYIQQALTSVNSALQDAHTALQTYHGKPIEIFEQVTAAYDVQAVYCNKDYEPDAIKRDDTVRNYLLHKNIPFHTYKDHVIFEQSEITKIDGTPYTVYTPYAKKWLSELKPEHYAAKSVDLTPWHKVDHSSIITLADLGFKKTDLTFQAPEIDLNIIMDYDKYRNFPALNRTTHLGIALRFGTISIRKCVAFALQYNATWLSELIWREFFTQILHHFPKVVDTCFKAKYEQINWRNNEHEFELWCKGETGYPIVDAGMRQLNLTGFMHNRVRMVVASFLCKHLLIDWRWGEAYFAEKLNDYDLSANNGNWQWAAGCGCDAAPYFRIFNPTAQTQKFDKDLAYVKTWYPEYDLQLTPPIVDHTFARERALRAYKQALQDTEIQ